MVTYNEDMNIPLFNKKQWKMTGECDVSVQRHTECEQCNQTKLCWVIAQPDFGCVVCDECYKELNQTASVSMEKADGKS